jgi:hypothetical protein
MMRQLYLTLALIGLALPYSQFVPWLAQHGPDLPLIFAELFSTRMGAFFGFDVLVSAVVLIVFIRREGATRKCEVYGYPLRPLAWLV